MTKFEKWIAAQGGLHGTGRLVGVTHVTVLRWLRGDNSVTEKNAKKILKASNFKITAKDLLTHTYRKQLARC